MEIPYDTIDMDFMNENQSAHGGREFGHIVTRMRIERKVIAGYWADKKVQERLASWMRTAVGIMESSHIRVCRVADNMRNVAVTEGDKVEAQMKFGWEIDAYPVNEIAEYVQDVSQGDIDVLVEEYYNKYDMILDGRDPEEFKKHVAVQAGIEIGFERFLEEKNYQAIVTHFGDLGSLKQLPGLAIQRLMEKGYGFGGEGDWKTAAMVRLLINEVECKKTEKPMPALPVGTAGHRSRIFPQQQKHGSLPAAHITLHLPMTLLQSRWATGQQLWVLKRFILMVIQRSGICRMS